MFIYRIIHDTAFGPVESSLPVVWSKFSSF